jgi:two-component system, LytTR family, sensor kinase
MHSLRLFWEKSFTDLRYRVVLHAGFWIFLLLFWLQENLMVQIGLKQNYLRTFLEMLVFLFLYYPLVYLILPLARKRRFRPAMILFVVYYSLPLLLRSYHFLFLNVLGGGVHQVGDELYFWDAFFQDQLSPHRQISLALSSFTSLMSVIYLPLLLKFVRYSYRFNLRQAQLQKENVQMELNFLKAQVNPHLLFNTLNNLQSFIIHNERERSVNLIGRLADFMRFSLYEGKAEFIPLPQELDLIQNYLEIERVRYDEKASIRFSTAGNMEGVQIPTLLLMPLVENAFTHGLDSTTTSGRVTIQVEAGEKQLYFLIENSHCENQKDQQPAKPGGIGIKNVRKRLQHYYPDRHRFEIEAKNDLFRVSIYMHLP